MRRAPWLALACAALVSGCAAPVYRYAGDQPGTATGAGPVYFKVPSAWDGFSATQITAAQKQWSTDATVQPLLNATVWQEAFDAAPRPSLTHVLGSQVPDSPVVYASLRTLYQAESDAASTSSLRDMLVPLSTLGDQVTVSRDETVTQGTATGVHLVFSFKPTPSSPQETVDQTAYLAGNRGAVYLLVVRCSSACYEQHRADIDTVTASYTIQEGRRG